MKIEDEIQSTNPIDLSKKVMLNLHFTRNTISDKFSEILRPYGISVEQFNVLRILRGQNGETVNMTSIQERMMTKNSNATRLIDKLLLKDMVTRNVCKDNRRKMEIKITTTGLETLEALDVKVVEHDKQFTQNLSVNEQSILNDLLEKLRIIKQ